MKNNKINNSEFTQLDFVKEIMKDRVDGKVDSMSADELFARKSKIDELYDSLENKYGDDGYNLPHDIAIYLDWEMENILKEYGVKQEVDYGNKFWGWHLEKHTFKNFVKKDR